MRELLAAVHLDRWVLPALLVWPTVGSMLIFMFGRTPLPGREPGFAAWRDVRALRLDARGSWSLVLSDGAEVIVGRSDARPRLSRFARLLPQLTAQPRQLLRRADLRYTNGFALQWMDVPAAAAGTTAQGNT